MRTTRTVVSESLGGEFRIMPVFGFRSMVSGEDIYRGLEVSVRRRWGIFPYWETLRVVDTMEQAHDVIANWNDVHYLTTDEARP